MVSIPGTFTSLLQLPDIPAGWARILGLLVIIIGIYDYYVATNEMAALIQLSVYLRFFFAFGVFSLFLTSQMPKEILPLGLIDALTAVWTMWSIKADTKK